MKHMKKYSGAIAALTAAIVIKATIQNIGIENIPLSIQVSALIFGPLILGLVTFVTTKRIQKHFMIFLILFDIYGIVVALMLIFENSNPEYVKIFRTPFIVITIFMFLAMFIVLLAGLSDTHKKNNNSTRALYFRSKLFNDYFNFIDIVKCKYLIVTVMLTKRNYRNLYTGFCSFSFWL